MNRKIKLIWDFHGGDAQGTAEHHLRHLKQFMEREKLEMVRTSVQSANDLHSMACLTVNEKDVRILRDTLKPNRAFVVE
ncbi:MAG: hypothetical protein ABJG68_13645 [Crocinitomicaceae bacterium]